MRRNVSLVFLRMMACKLLTLDGHRVSVWALVLGMESCEPLLVGGKRILRYWGLPVQSFVTERTNWRLQFGQEQKEYTPCSPLRCEALDAAVGSQLLVATDEQASTMKLDLNLYLVSSPLETVRRHNSFNLKTKMCVYSLAAFCLPLFSTLQSLDFPLLLFPFSPAHSR